MFKYSKATEIFVPLPVGCVHRSSRMTLKHVWAFFGWDKFLNFVRKHNHAYFVVILYGRKRRDCADFCCNLIFKCFIDPKFPEALTSTEASPLIHALLTFNKGAAATGSHIPVNRPEFHRQAGIHAPRQTPCPPFKNTVVLTQNASLTRRRV